MRGETYFGQPIELAILAFQSTLPMRGETSPGCGWRDRSPISIHSPHAGRDESSDTESYHHAISIHSPHAGRDVTSHYPSDLSYHFNPLSPCGERPSLVPTFSTAAKFQSTLPMRGETGSYIPQVMQGNDFNPLSPCGERPWCRKKDRRLYHFNPLSPCGERLDLLLLFHG